MGAVGSAILFPLLSAPTRRGPRFELIIEREQGHVNGKSENVPFVRLSVFIAGGSGTWVFMDQSKNSKITLLNVQLADAEPSLLSHADGTLELSKFWSHNQSYCADFEFYRICVSGTYQHVIIKVWFDDTHLYTAHSWSTEEAMNAEQNQQRTGNSLFAQTDNDPEY